MDGGSTAGLAYWTGTELGKKTFSTIIEKALKGRGGGWGEGWEGWGGG